MRAIRIARCICAFMSTANDVLEDVCMLTQQNRQPAARQVSKGRGVAVRDAVSGDTQKNGPGAVHPAHGLQGEGILQLYPEDMR